MHELGIVIQIVKQLERYMDEQNIKEIHTLVLQVGELSGVYPKYIEDVYPIAVEHSKLENTKLKMEITPGLGKCDDCDFNYNLVENNNTCPLCESKTFSIISGKEFLIKEIHAL